MIIDTHFHAFPGAYLERLPEGPRNERGKAFRPFDNAYYLEVMDRHSIDVGVLSNQAAPIEKSGGRALALDLSRALNDGFIEATVRCHERFRAFARLPMLDMDDTVAELERCLAEPGVVGVVSPTNVDGRYLDEPFFAPLWEALERAGVPLFLHPTYAPCTPNWEVYSLRHKILWPVDTTLALSRIVYSGVLDRHPGATIIAAHLGGLALLYLDRLDWPEGDIACVDLPESYFRRFYYDIAGPSRAPAVGFAAATVGADYLLFGGDFPHGRGGRDDEFYPIAHQAMAEVDLTAQEKELIYCRNAQALLGLG